MASVYGGCLDGGDGTKSTLTRAKVEGEKGRMVNAVCGQRKLSERCCPLGCDVDLKGGPLFDAKVLPALQSSGAQVLLAALTL